MRSMVLAAAVLAAASMHGEAATKKHVIHHVVHRPVHHAVVSSRCSSPADLEAEQAIRFQTHVMVVSSACRDTIYAEFRLRNRLAIIAYQNEMIAHFRREGARAPDRAFETWITHLANEASREQSGLPTAQICQQSAPMMKQASLLDAKGLHQFAAAQAATVSANYTKCIR
jgi:hypothetical protein